ncbi:hypothetical protein CH063_06132 [Colletotrichum higginsianum]|uniref:Uncharacterized protein n=1 Tax=Colletotrichum higginsianum (strain IMI 349063) TaxID=759273 RepID=H1V1F6_COLHI|nr:hypothetical protein CH063_06132 [Colletotrichum higginsianum]
MISRGIYIQSQTKNTRYRIGRPGPPSRHRKLHVKVFGPSGPSILCTAEVVFTPCPGHAGPSHRGPACRQLQQRPGPVRHGQFAATTFLLYQVSQPLTRYRRGRRGRSRHRQPG